MVMNIKKEIGLFNDRVRFFFKKEFRIVQYENQLTTETYYFIESRILWWWFENNQNEKPKLWKRLILSERTYRLYTKNLFHQNKISQDKFGYDNDGMFGDLKNAVTIMKYLRGDIKLIKTVRKNIEL